MKLNYKIYDFTNPWVENKTPLLMIHGICADLNMWFYQVPEFAKIFPVILIDLPGHGESPEPENEISIKEMAESINETVNPLIEGKINVLGISLGGVVATEYVNLYSDEVNKLVISSTPRSAPEEVIPYFDNLLNEYSKMDMKTISTMAADNNRQFSQTMPVEMRNWGIKYFSQIKHSAFMKVVKAPLRYDINSVFPKINTETLIIANENDPYLSVEDAKKTEDAIKNSELFVINGSGHIPTIEKPDEFNEKVMDFLTKT